MRIGSTDTERTNSRSSRLLAAFPLAVLITDEKRAVLKVDLWVGVFVVKRRRNLLIMKRHCHFDQTRYTRSSDRVANV